MSRYASNQEVVRFFASHGIEVTHVRRDGPLRHLRANGQALTLPMPASADECLRRVRESLASLATPSRIICSTVLESAKVTVLLPTGFPTLADSPCRKAER